MAKIEKYIIKDNVKNADLMIAAYGGYTIFVIDDEEFIMDEEIYIFNEEYKQYLTKLEQL